MGTRSSHKQDAGPLLVVRDKLGPFYRVLEYRIRLLHKDEVTSSMILRTHASHTAILRQPSPNWNFMGGAFTRTITVRSHNHPLAGYFSTLKSGSPTWSSTWIRLHYCRSWRSEI